MKSIPYAATLGRQLFFNMQEKTNNTTSGQQPLANPIPTSDGPDYLELIGVQGEELRKQRKLLNWTFGFIIAILIICFVAFITFLLDAWRFHQESYIEFTKTLEQVNLRLTTPLPSPASNPTSTHNPKPAP